MDAARRCPRDLSLSTDGPRGASGAGLSDPETPSRGGRNVKMPGTTGLFKLPGSQGKASDIRGVEAFHTDATEEGQSNHNVGRRGLHPEEAQRTVRLGGSKTLKPAERGLTRMEVQKAKEITI
ncbi:hypothetical protein NDU88_005473 [Pleurodeles waltl]|uniref:Uncharacterized protein n=1 Tax=Pleurodeles waltl TaxID=8319 RepID=A0AAV7SLQ6_PLEWA|nr:hypothetical protein NDU88_005473 [Pleurodeles waltl]